jgi:hypothetical protein
VAQLKPVEAQRYRDERRKQYGWDFIQIAVSTGATLRVAASSRLCASNYPGELMVDRQKAIRLAAAVVGLVIALSPSIVPRFRKRQPISLRGTVIKQDDDPMQESPVTDVEISAANDLATSSAKSTFNGYFTLPLRRGVARNQSITLRFRHPDYQPLDLNEQVDDKLSVVHLIPINREPRVQLDRPPIAITNVLVRYETVATAQESIGTGAKTFQVQNVGNVPCDHNSHCSPDRKWKATVTSESLDAGEGSVFRNARVSCLAGPCPFTRIDSDGFSRGGRHINVSVRNWSDTTTFLLQAEVFRSQINNTVRITYPVILGTSLNFTLPPSADGPSIEAEVNGENMVFPLGPKPILSWAECNVINDKFETKVYRCDLKSDYKFR